MRLASFLFLSLTLHAAALGYPVSFPDFNPGELIRVIILPIEQQPPISGAQGANNRTRATQTAAKSSGPSAQPPQHLIKANSISISEPRSEFAEALPNAIENNSAALVDVPSKSVETNGSAKVISAGHNGNGFEDGGFGTDGNGLGSSGSGMGHGNGDGSSGNSAVLIQARYSETPKPVYPERARSEGREGRVLLRVLVDNQGRTKRVEINNSSGSEALDRAAAEAIKRWRFIPARYGDKAVESWIRVPVDFSLADSNSW